VNGSAGNSQNAGHIPGAHGAVITADRHPLCRSSFWCVNNRAEVNLSPGEEELAIARRTSLLSGVKKEFWGEEV